MEKLARKLLRPGENPKEQAVRKRLGTLGSGVGVAVNLLLTAVKFFVGSVTGSVAVVSPGSEAVVSSGSVTVVSSGSVTVVSSGSVTVVSSGSVTTGRAGMISVLSVV